MSAPRMIVDLAAVRFNFEWYRRRHDRVAAVVKGNAYGLGMEAVAEALVDLGCGEFFVATVAEGEALRRVVGDAWIAVLAGPIVERDVDRLNRARLHPVINNADQLALFGDARPPIVVHIDTGLNRLGFRDARTAAHAVDEFPVRLVLSHYACADESAHAMNEEQLCRFEADRAVFEGVPWSMANSAAALGEGETGLARIGLGLTGASPLLDARTETPLRPTARVEAAVVGVYALRAGESVGYGATYTAQRDERVAVISMGYADGVRRSLSNRGAFYAGDRRLPIRGRVSMDLTTVSLTDDEPLNVGDYVEWFGGFQSLEAVAEEAETLNYEILTGIGPRVERRYVGWQRKRSSD